MPKGKPASWWCLGWGNEQAIPSPIREKGMETNGKSIQHVAKHWKAATFGITQACSFIRGSDGNRKEILMANFLSVPVISSTFLKH